MLAVILAAIQDALGRSADNHHRHEREYHRRLARQWFDNNSRDFQVVCLAAGLEPSEVRTRALTYIDTHTPKQKKSGRVPRHGAPIADVAMRAGVCIDLARRVLNDTGTVLPEVEARIRAAHAELLELREAA